MECAVAADCGSSSVLSDEDNYACEAGLCKYLGCISDSERTSALMSPNYVCSGPP
jgi:hypothetical protein